MSFILEIGFFKKFFEIFIEIFTREDKFSHQTCKKILTCKSLWIFLF